jgi:hypothetical protein
VQWIQEEFGISVSDDTVYRMLKSLGFSHVSARPKAYKQTDETLTAFKTYGPPRLQEVSAIRSEQFASTYPVSGQRPGQDGGSRVPVLIKFTATERHFLNQGSETPNDCQAISLHHQQTIESRSCVKRGRN